LKRTIFSQLEAQVNINLAAAPTIIDKMQSLVYSPAGFVIDRCNFHRVDLADK